MQKLQKRVQSLLIKMQYSMGEHIEKQFMLSQKLGRNTLPERRVGVLNEEHSEEVI